MGCCKAMDIFPNYVGFQIDDGAGMLVDERRIGHRMGNDGNGKLAVAYGNDGQADAVDGYRAFFDDERLHVLGNGNRNDPGDAVGGDAGDMADAVDMAADDVAAQPAADLHSPFQIDLRAALDVAQGRTAHRFVHDVGREGRIRHGGHRQADAVDGDAVAELRPFQYLTGLNRQLYRVGTAVHLADGAQFLNDASEHKLPPCSHYTL